MIRWANKNLFDKSAAVIGLDIGSSSIRTIEIDNSDGSMKALSYGAAEIDPKNIKDGAIINITEVAKDIKHMFTDELTGQITTSKVAIGVPSIQTFSRSMTIPNVDAKDIEEVTRIEIEQYAPLPIDELYIDWEIIHKGSTSQQIIIVATPKPVVDSRMDLAKILGLNVVSVQPTIHAATRFFSLIDKSATPTILLDLDHTSSDIAAYDTRVRLTSSIPGGSSDFIKSISEKLSVGESEAEIIKDRYGLNVSKKQESITRALEPILDNLVKEIKRTIRYYEDHLSTGQSIGQIITMGSGANVPGLSDYITSSLRLPTRICNPWRYIDINHLQQPKSTEETSYIGCAGLSLVDIGRIVS